MALTTLAGFLALAVDAGNIVENHTDFQNAADAAALSAASDVRQGTGTLDQAQATATTDAVAVGGGYITNDGGSPGNWDSCSEPAGFSPELTGTASVDNCVAFYQPSLALTNVGTNTPTLTIGAPGNEAFGVSVPAGKHCCHADGSKRGGERYGHFLRDRRQPYPAHQLQRRNDGGEPRDGKSQPNDL